MLKGLRRYRCDEGMEDRLLGVCVWIVRLCIRCTINMSLASLSIIGGRYQMSAPNVCSIHVWSCTVSANSRVVKYGECISPRDKSLGNSIDEKKPVA